jgi:photosystem II stability/assembly factor-like uncharacterized protein
MLATHCFFLSIIFADDSTGVATGTEQRYWITTDGGLTWKAQAIGGLQKSITPGSDNLVKTAITSSGVFYGLGQLEEAGSAIYTSRDVGTSWKEAHFPKTVLNDVVSVGDEAWIVGAIHAYGAVLHTRGDGLWTRIWSGGKGEFLTAVQFVDGTAGWSVGGRGLIMHTIDGGQVWAKQNSLTQVNLESVAFADSRSGYVVGEDGTLLHTTDGGSTWEKQDSGTKEYLKKVVATSPNEAWAVGMAGTVLKTVDAGKHWEKISIGTRADVYAITNKGGEIWIATSDGTIVKYRA